MKRREDGSAAEELDRRSDWYWLAELTVYLIVVTVWVFLLKNYYDNTLSGFWLAWGSFACLLTMAGATMTVLSITPTRTHLQQRDHHVQERSG